MAPNENLRQGERRNVTVLFADMKDFTALTERLDPEEVDSLISRVFSSFETIIRKYGGVVEKYIGDAMVAVFGAPHMHEDDPERCVNSALDFLHEIDRLNRSLAPRNLGIAFRIGINSGLITTGKRGDHDVITGHAMSVASRLESSAKANTVLVSESTKSLCSDDFVFSEQMSITVKGKSAPVTAYSVLRRSPEPTAADSPFIGRKDLIDRLMRRYLRHDPTGVDGFVLTGEPGIGKTRVATELIDKARRLPDFDSAIFHARARRYRTEPFAVITDLLASCFDVQPEMAPGVITERVLARTGVEPVSAEGFGRLLTGEVQENENQAFVLLYLLMKSAVKRSENSPYSALLFIDNVRMLDKGSRDFLRFYLKNADAKPFFILTDRELGPNVADLADSLERIEMGPMDREESRTLVSSIAGDGLEMLLVGSILDNSRGNPLFLREYARYAAQNRDVREVPASIQNIFMTSIDNLEPEYRDFLKRMSVFVHSFSLDDARHVQEVTDGEPSIVDDALARYVEDGTLVRDGELYMFRLEVFKTALYASILNYNKKIIHRVIADLMERKGSPHPARLLHHLFRAEEWNRAYVALCGSPNITSGLEYLRHIDRLLEQTGADQPDRQVNLMFLKSAILFKNGMSDQADSLLKEIMATAVARQNALYAASAYHLLSASYLQASCFDKADFCGHKAKAYYERAGRGATNTQDLLEILATSAALQNDTEAAEQLMDEIAALKDAPGTPYSAQRYASVKAEHQLMRGEYAAARTLLLQTRAQISAGDENWLPVNTNLGLACYHLCDWEGVLQYDGAAIDSGSGRLAAVSQTNTRLAIANHLQGRLDEAEKRFQTAEFNASQVRNDFDLVDSQRTLAEALLICGEVERAEKTAATGVSIGLRHAGTYPVLTLLMVLVETAVIKGDHERARFFLSEADLLLERGVLVRRRDVLLYHYYHFTLLPADAGSSREKAMEILRRELHSLDEDRFVEAFLATRRFRAIRAELESTE